MKNFVFRIAVVAILAAVAALSVFVPMLAVSAAEEVPDTAATMGEEPAEGAEGATDPGLVDRVTVAVKEALAGESYFNTTVLPVIVSWGATVVAGVALLAPYLKKGARYNQLQGIYTKLREENESLKHLLDTTDVTRFQGALKGVLNEIMIDFEAQIAAMRKDSADVTEVSAQMKILSAQVAALINGAANAWHNSEAAVACLTAAPTERAVREQTAEKVALENYIREQKGEEADAIIQKLEAESHD